MTSRDWESFTRDVLARTSGPACGRVETLLAGSFDDALDGNARDLVRIHIDGCQSCERLARAFERQAVSLAALAEIEPDGNFLPDVLARTIPAAPPTSAWVAALRRAWERWLTRPRFAWEAAYVGTLGIWLLVGPTLALSASVPEPLPVAPLAVLADARELGARVWQVTGQRGIDTANGLGRDLVARYDGVRNGVQDLGRHAAAIRSTAVDLEAAAVTLRDLGRDLARTWKRLWSSGESSKPETERKERAR